MRSWRVEVGAGEEERWYVVAPAAARARVVRRSAVREDFGGEGGVDWVVVLVGDAREVEKAD